MKSRFCSTRMNPSPRRSPSRRRVSTIQVDDRGLNALRRLVEKHEARLSAQAARHREDLLLAPAELPPEPVQQGLEPRKLLEHPVDDLRFLPAPGEGAHAKVFQHRDTREDLPALGDVAEAHARALERRRLRDVLALELDRSARRPDEPHRRLHERALAHAVVPQDSDRFAVRDTQVDTVKDRYSAIAGAQSANLKHSAPRPGDPGRCLAPAGCGAAGPSCPR